MPRTPGGLRSFKAMLRHLITRLHHARGTQLKRRYENSLTSAISEGSKPIASARAQLLFNDWVERFGPVKDCEVRVRQHTVKEMRGDARRRYEHDIGAAYAFEFLSHHVEASYLRGEDAAFVYDLTSYYISQAGDAARGMAGKPPDESEPSSGGL
jgi:hypothetical protein